MVGGGSGVVCNKHCLLTVLVFFYFVNFTSHSGGHLQLKVTRDINYTFILTVNYKFEAKIWSTWFKGLTKV